MPRQSKVTPFHDLVGTVPDREIAVMADVSLATVHNYRRRYNIPSYRSTLATSTALPTKQSPQSSTRNTPATPSGYAVTVQTEHGPQKYTVIAADIVDAGEKAAHLNQTITAIAYLGPALQAAPVVS